MSNDALTRREAWILLARFGLLDGRHWTLAECAEKMPQDVIGTPGYRPSRERLRQMEAEAVAKLRKLAKP